MQPHSKCKTTQNPCEAWKDNPKSGSGKSTESAMHEVHLIPNTHKTREQTTGTDSKQQTPKAMALVQCGRQNPFLVKGPAATLTDIEKCMKHSSIQCSPHQITLSFLASVKCPRLIFAASRELAMEGYATRPVEVKLGNPVSKTACRGSLHNATRPVCSKRVLATCESDGHLGLGVGSREHVLRKLLEDGEE